ncbi:aldehyde ferredoxin oxidoreductase family protein [Natronorubrum sp. FCH18a]|uniref:aldehyde ferredoxin oxidoreductase family protein n=1 Tax=Natronorubrum sp. FCH18a TaxID=3447018 RepID=UPI003F50F88C
MLHVNGPLLSIDVTDRTTTVANITDECERFIGGRGLGTKLAHDRIPFDADPFGPENRLFFTLGPMQSTTMSFTGRMNATSLSPLTDGMASSNAGGFTSRPMAKTGYSAVEFVGESDELLAVHISEDEVTFEPVPELSEATVAETGDYMQETHGIGENKLIVTGPAGENLVRYAAIITSGSRIFGRGGLGAVLGSKNVKAISFDGDAELDIDLGDVRDEVNYRARTYDHEMKRSGTNSVTALSSQRNALPTENFKRQSYEEGIDGIDGDAVAEKKHKKGTCSACAFACKVPTKDEETGMETDGPEHETAMSFGSNVLVDDIVSVMKSNELCDQLGMDTISAGNTIAAYLESEGGFGDDDLIHELIEKIAYREGIGDILAEGVDRIHADLGVENWTVKGMEVPSHDGRELHGQGLSYATANLGADHMYARFYSKEYPLLPREEALESHGLEGKAAPLIERENKMALNDSGILCQFSFYVSEDRYERAFDADYEDLLEIGARTVEHERRFNNQRGFDRTDDTLPYDLPGFEAALDEYYELRGWNEDGTVPAATQ